MAAAISLSLPPGAMFSIMFTKHEILNYRDRQEEFWWCSAIVLRISREPPRLVASRRILCFPHQTLSNAEQSLKDLAHQAALEETSDWIQRSSLQFSVCLLNGGQAFGSRRPLHLYRDSVPAALKKANELLSGGFFNVEIVMPDGAAHHPASSIN